VTWLIHMCALSHSYTVKLQQRSRISRDWEIWDRSKRVCNTFLQIWKAYMSLSWKYCVRILFFWPRPPRRKVATKLVRCSVFELVAEGCSLWQCVAVCCSVLQCGKQKGRDEIGGMTPSGTLVWLGVAGCAAVCIAVRVAVYVAVWAWGLAVLLSGSAL